MPYKICVVGLYGLLLPHKNEFHHNFTVVYVRNFIREYLCKCPITLSYFAFRLHSELESGRADMADFLNYVFATIYIIYNPTSFSLGSMDISTDLPPHCLSVWSAPLYFVL